MESPQSIASTVIWPKLLLPTSGSSLAEVPVRTGHACSPALRRSATRRTAMSRHTPLPLDSVTEGGWGV